MKQLLLPLDDEARPQNGAWLQPQKPKCLREVPAVEWRTRGWYKLALCVAVMCLAENDCDKCYDMITGFRRNGGIL